MSLNLAGPANRESVVKCLSVDVCGCADGSKHSEVGWKVICVCLLRKTAFVSVSKGGKEGLYGRVWNLVARGQCLGS